MRIYRKDETGKTVYIADYQLPREVGNAIDSGREVQYELPPVMPAARPIGCDAAPDYAATVAIERILLEPYRLYRNGVLVEMGAMIADPRHVTMLAENVKRRAAARGEVNAITAAWQERA
ncbi:hypothetical protein E4630_16200 [Aeromonas hydrophila]|uniref:hypothetical protein n=1 Tax=Aeromonas hydrophila TaxID=644 RepID=UPI00107E9022|nr:hypothetical protein [Aeromonas hydrophila]QBX72262.1 hypothetical protein E4625_16425 [Aeromonas hydrophila]QBX76962.1 hypothetical protein E4630_16200 [Aeromonas hydrophila]